MPSPCSWEASAVALQGSIDTFALDDVLRLVASTAKTGRLTLHGSRGSGELLVRDGQILDGTVTTDEHVGDLTELVFELLRFEDGEFEFDATTIDGYRGRRAGRGRRAHRQCLRAARRMAGDRERRAVARRVREAGPRGAGRHGEDRGRPVAHDRRGRRRGTGRGALGAPRRQPSRHRPSAALPDQERPHRRGRRRGGRRRPRGPGPGRRRRGPRDHRLRAVHPRAGDLGRRARAVVR